MAGSSWLRETLKKEYREYRAIRILSNSLGAVDRGHVDRTLRGIDSYPRKRLSDLRKKLVPELSRMRRDLGVLVGLKSLEAVLGEGIPRDGFTMLQVPKERMQKLFGNYGAAWPLYDKLPLHASIQVDAVGIRHRVLPQFTWVLLEASLFEDMALMWNQLVVKGPHKNSDPGLAGIPEFKWVCAVERSCVVAVFHLLEGYLNGVAYDVFRRKHAELSDEQRAMLCEWDFAKSRAKYLTLRDKILQYPRLATGAAAPLVQETNCPELRVVLERETSYRHALVHPSPKVEFWRDNVMRERAFYGMTLAEIGLLVDAAAILIRRIGAGVGPAYGDVGAWLWDRGQDGLFPRKAFQ